LTKLKKKGRRKHRSQIDYMIVSSSAGTLKLDTRTKLISTSFSVIQHLGMGLFHCNSTILFFLIPSILFYSKLASHTTIDTATTTVTNIRQQYDVAAVEESSLSFNSEEDALLVVGVVVGCIVVLMGGVVSVVVGVVVVGATEVGVREEDGVIVVGDGVVGGHSNWHPSNEIVSTSCSKHALYPVYSC